MTGVQTCALPILGKSTLVNRLCRSREAIVHDEPGVTRDRTYQDGYWRDRHFKVVDTGGLNRYPWNRSQPSSISSVTCSLRLTP